MEPVRVSLAAGAARSGLRSLIVVGTGARPPRWSRWRPWARLLGLADVACTSSAGRSTSVMACSFDGWSSRTAAVAPPRSSLAGPSGCRPSEAVAVIRRHRLECSDDPQLAENDPPLRVVLVVVDPLGHQVDPLRDEQRDGRRVVNDLAVDRRPGRARPGRVGGLQTQCPLDLAVELAAAELGGVEVVGAVGHKRPTPEPDGEVGGRRGTL